MMKTDTDSLSYFIKTEDLYDDLKNDESLQKQIEFSNYPTNHPLYKNKLDFFKMNALEKKWL